MARQPRVDIGDYVYHVLNRANARKQIFHTEADYLDFEYLLTEIVDTYAMRILSYVIMPNHWHMLLYPREDKDMSTALRWLSTSHVRRHHTRQGTIGSGHVYQGRYKSFLVEEDQHLLTVLKYIERNPVRAKLVARAEDWRWGSAYRRTYGTMRQRRILAELPVDMPRNYRRWVNDPEPSEELDSIRHSIAKDVPYGDVLIERKL